MTSLTLSAPAKLNLTLDILGTRPDGYHEIETFMQEVSLADLVTVTRHPDGGQREITVTCSDPLIPTDRRNIVWKCAEAFFEHFAISAYRIGINIEKHIPSEAGLAGGSSDGAAALKLLNRLFGTNADLAVLCAIGATVGADIPFCLTGGGCVCRGIGERIEKLSQPGPRYALLIAMPRDARVSTAEAYRRLDEFPAPPGADPGIAPLLGQLGKGSLPTALYNEFERVAPAGSILLIERMTELGAVAARMSGSGPSVFGVFRTMAERDEAGRVLDKDGAAIYPAYTIP